MARRAKSEKRQILPDPKYGDLQVAKFVNTIMKNGKKSVAEKIIYGALDIIESRGHKEPLDIFKQAIKKVSPLVEVKSRRVGGSNYQVPTEVSASRGRALSMRWLVEAARKRSEKSTDLRMANELLDAYQEKGGAFKKREDTHRMAEANKAFSHYRW